MVYIKNRNEKETDIRKGEHVSLSNCSYFPLRGKALVLIGSQD